MHSREGTSTARAPCVPPSWIGLGASNPGKRSEHKDTKASNSRERHYPDANDGEGSATGGGLGDLLATGAEKWRLPWIVMQ
jgi:hypothetical protein